MNNDVVVQVSKLTKCYKLYDKPIDRLKESLHPLHRQYHRDFFALKDVSFDIKRGETVGIIGKNGSGKSTLLKMITGVLTPSSGTITVKGKISALLELGAGFNPEFTGIENIYMNGTIMGYSKREMDDKIPAIVEFADIGDFIHQPVKMYSSGMFARLAFAVSINVEPDILIVDEALSVGDVFFQNKCFKKFADLKDKGVTILFVSHDMGSIKQMTSRVLWLSGGQQKMFDSTDIVCEAYFNEQLQAQNALNKDLALLKPALKTAIVDSSNKVSFPQLSIIGKHVLSDIAAIKSCFVMDEQGKRVDVLQVDMSYTLVMVAEFFQAIDNIIFGFVIENNKGLQIISMNSFINNEERLIDINKPCVMKVDFAFRLPRFLKGEYLLSPAIAQGQQSQHIMLTWLSGISKIYIENGGYNLSLLEIPGKVALVEYQRECVDFFGSD